MKKTKRRILTVAKSLFNDHGFLNVTIRMIAEELGMSSGNLNYHYRTRDEILEALYFEMVEVFDTRVENVEEQDISLATMKKEIRISMERMIDYKFFWTDLYNLLSLNEKIYGHFYKAQSKRVFGYKFVLNKLREGGQLDSFEIEKEESFLIDRMINFSNTWLYASILYKNKLNQKFINEQSMMLLSMLYPYLTTKGKEEFKELL